MLQHIFTSDGSIDKIHLKENALKIMDPHDPTGFLAGLIERLVKGREFTREGGKIIADAMMVSKGITLLAQMAIFNENIREWRIQTTNLKTWGTFKTFFNDPTVNKV